MGWCAKIREAGVARAVAAALCLVSVVHAAGDAEVDQWFSRHSDDEWRPLAARWDSVKAAMQAPTENLALPLDFHPNGRVRARLKAEKAQVFADGTIFAEGVEVEMLTDTGAADGQLTAEGCLFDRETKRGYCDGPVSVAKDGDMLKGRGMYFSIEDQFIKIMGECEIRTRRMKNNFGRIW